MAGMKVELNKGKSKLVGKIEKRKYQNITSIQLAMEYKAWNQGSSLY